MCSNVIIIEFIFRTQVREDFAELYEQHEPTWREEEDERVHRWEAFLSDLNARYGSGY